MSLHQSPLFKVIHCAGPYLQSFNHIFGPPSLSTIPYAEDLSTWLFNFIGKQELSDCASRILWGLRNLSILKELTNIYESNSPDCITFRDHVEVLEREVQSRLHDTLEDGNRIPSDGAANPFFIFIIFAYASLLHICFCLSRLMPKYPFQ
jgi:hypothetical protein